MRDVVKTPKSIAFFSPQGVLEVTDNQFVAKQGRTSENGGQCIYVIEMARALAKQGHRIDVFARAYHDKDTPAPQQIVVEEPDDYPGMRVIHVPSSANSNIDDPDHVLKEDFYAYYPEYMGRVEAFLEGDDLSIYDSVVGHYADGMFMASVFAKAQRQKEPEHPITAIGITHSLGLEKTGSLWRKELEKAEGVVGACQEAFSQALVSYNIPIRLACETAAIRELDSVACVSQGHMKTLYDDHGLPESWMDILPGGINETVFAPRKAEDPRAKKAELFLSLNTEARAFNSKEAIRNAVEGRVIFGFGRLVEAKGVNKAVEAMEHILEEHPDAVYVYAGGNVPGTNSEEKAILQQAYEHAAEKGYGDRIVFLGRQDQTTIADWLNASDVYLHAANLEPFGLAPQEAAATGIPVVLSKTAGVAEVLENNEQALHVDPLDPEDIAKQVVRILENEALGQRFAQRAIKYIQTEATWTGRAEQLVDLTDYASQFVDQKPDLNPVDNADFDSAIMEMGRLEATPAMTEPEKTAMSHMKAQMVEILTQSQQHVAMTPALDVDNEPREDALEHQTGT